MPSPSLVSTQGLRKICISLIVLGLLAAGYALVQRMRAENSSRAVEIVVDYNEAVALAGAEGKSVTDVLLTLHKSGATAVALQEETLNNMEAQGAISLAQHPEVTAGHYVSTWGTDDQVFAIETPGLRANQMLFTQLARVYPRANLADEAPFRILVRGSRDAVCGIGLGLSPTKVAYIKLAELRVIPRMRGGSWSSSKMRDAMRNMQMLVQDTGKYPYTGTVIFDGETLPGYRDLIPDLADILKDRKITYGSIEFSKQKGDAELGAKLDGQLLRVHSVSLEEASNLKTSQIVQRFALAVKDRNIRVLYLHMPPLASQDPLIAAQDYVQAISGEIRHEGFPLATAKPAHPFHPLALSRPVLALLFIASGAAMLLWVLMILPTQLTVRQRTIFYAVLAVGLLGALGCALVRQSEGRALFGLLAAISFPLLSLTWAYRLVDQFATSRPAKPLWPALGALIIATGITLGGAVLIAAMMSESRYLVKVGQFVGVKFALAIPLLLFSALIATDGVARAGETLASYGTRCRERLQNFFSQPIHVWGVVVAVVALAAVGLLLARSGNDSGVGVSNFELHLRSMLEQWMVARPRTKEFAFGHPLFIFSIVAAARGYRGLALLLLLGAAVGQTDVLNTYCHAHTPVMLSLIRTFNGLWLGMLISVVALFLFAWRSLSAETAKVPVE